jgi:hypothetical protein
MSYADLIKKIEAEKLAAENVREVQEYERAGHELATRREADEAARREAEAADNADWDNAPENWDNPVHGDRRGPYRTP